jgi:uncharacterized protein (TIGR02145 family)
VISSSGGTQDLASVLAIDNKANAQIKDLIDPTDDQDAATKAYVTFRVSLTGDTLFLGTGQWVVIPGISLANSGSGTSIVDGSGNLYTSVTIGTQDWLVENLRTTKFMDGTDIPLITDNASWSNSVTPAYCWYDNHKTTYGSTYGALYNWYVVSSGNVCPTGWHVPTISDWNTLIGFLGGDYQLAGGKLKESGTTHWSFPNTGATNEVGFTALPAGYRLDNGLYMEVYEIGVFWCSQTVPLIVRYDDAHLEIGHNPFYSYGFSIRCIKN